MYNSWHPPPCGVGICPIGTKFPTQSILSIFVKPLKLQYSVAIRSAGAAATPIGPARFGGGSGLWTPLKNLLPKTVGVGVGVNVAVAVAVGVNVAVAVGVNVGV